jgi:hypothetical protein
VTTLFAGEQQQIPAHSHFRMFHSWPSLSATLKSHPSHTLARTFSSLPAFFGAPHCLLRASSESRAISAAAHLHRHNRLPKMSQQAKDRLSVITRHLQTSSNLPLNTPYAVANRATQDNIAQPKQSIDSSSFSTKVPSKPQVPMSSQAPHAAVLIPGPIEYDDAVLQAMSHYRYVCREVQVNGNS